MLAPSKPVDVLQRARNLIADPKKWVRFWQGVDTEGQFVFPNDTRAVAFCALGALARANGNDFFESRPEDEARVEIQALMQAMQVSHVYDITIFNNTRSHEEVIAAFDKAIEIAARGRDRAGL